MEIGNAQLHPSVNTRGPSSSFVIYVRESLRISRELERGAESGRRTLRAKRTSARMRALYETVTGLV